MSKKNMVFLAAFIVSLAINFVQGYKLYGLTKSAYAPVFARPDRSKFATRATSLPTDAVPVVVIGSGPAGMSAALRSARAGYDTLMIKGGPGSLSQTEYVDNWLGSPHELAHSILDRSLKQVVSFGVRTNESMVERIDFSNWPYNIYLDDDTVVRACAIVVATGAYPRKLAVPGEKEYWGRGVTACARCDAPFYKGKEHAVVVGGGDSAIQEALELVPYVRSITILHRRDQLRASKHSRSLIAGYPSINVKYNVVVERVVGDDTFVRAVEVRDVRTNERQTIQTNGVFLAVGREPNTRLFESALELDDHGYIVLHGRSQETNVAGVFAAGDVADAQFRQADVAIGDGAKAGIEAAAFLAEIGCRPASA